MTLDTEMAFRFFKPSVNLKKPMLVDGPRVAQ
jgi:hypothetical protein